MTDPVLQDCVCPDAYIFWCILKYFWQASGVQVNVLVDETYAPDPTQYNLASFYSNYNITPADNSSYYFLQNSSVFR